MNSADVSSYSCCPPVPHPPSASSHFSLLSSSPSSYDDDDDDDDDDDNDDCHSCWDLCRCSVWMCCPAHSWKLLLCANFKGSQETAQEAGGREDEVAQGMVFGHEPEGPVPIYFVGSKNYQCRFEVCLRCI